MNLFELFDDGPLDVTDDIKQSLLDILTPMVASRVPFVTIQQIVDKLGQLRTGISIDRNLIMTLLDPDKIKIIDKIEGDRVYLKDASSPDRSLQQDDREKEAEHVDDMAKKQAQKSMGTGNKSDSPL
jgi:hypothetical protein